MIRISGRRRSAPGFTVCTSCGAVVASPDLRELVKAGKERGKWVCAVCAARRVARVLNG